MKTIIRLLALLAAMNFALAAQQKSDYAIVQHFQTLTKSIAKNIDQAKTMQECAEASTSIDAVEKEFGGDKTFINKANYPDGYDKTIEQLRGKLLIRQRDLGVIESQIVRITELEVKIRELSDQLMKLTNQNAALMAEVQQLTENVKKLSGDLFNSKTPIDSLRNMIVKLRQGLQERDALVFALTDSLFMQYDKNVGDMKDIEKQGLLGRIDRHGIIGNVKRSIIDNIAFLESTQLKGSDLVTLVRQQERFQSQWTGLAPKLTSLYLSGKSKKSEVGVVDSMLAMWQDKVDGAMWRSLSMLFKEKGFTVKEFKNDDEFVASFIAFFDEQTQNVNKETDDTRYKLFANFNENLWQTDLNATWLPALTELRKISDTQKKDIEAKFESWHASVMPGAKWLTYILIVLGVLLVAIVGVWVFRKGPKTTQKE
jgi:predicted  nucleic acid-binding Zn-ribbon protein